MSLNMDKESGKVLLFESFFAGNCFKIFFSEILGISMDSAYPKFLSH